MCSMKPLCWLAWHDGVAFGDEAVTDVSHHHRQDCVVPCAADLHGHHRVVDAAGRPVHDPYLPYQVGAVNVIAGDAHDPFRCGAEPFDEVRFPVDYHPLVAGSARASPGRSSVRHDARSSIWSADSMVVPFGPVLLPRQRTSALSPACSCPVRMMPRSGWMRPLL